MCFVWHWIRPFFLVHISRSWKVLDLLWMWSLAMWTILTPANLNIHWFGDTDCARQDCLTRLWQPFLSQRKWVWFVRLSWWSYFWSLENGQILVKLIFRIIQARGQQVRIWASIKGVWSGHPEVTVTTKGSILNHFLQYAIKIFENWVNFIRYHCLIDKLPLNFFERNLWCDLGKGTTSCC